MTLPLHNAKQRAYTLIEVVGVLAVIAILAAALSAKIIRRVDTAKSSREVTDLNTIADASTAYILRNTNIPAISLWASNIASEMSLPVSSITTNSRRFARLFIADPTFKIGGVYITNTTYTQTIAGSSLAPTNARILILSSPTLALPTVPNTTAEFNAIWNTQDGSKPTNTTWASWSGKAEDLFIKRLNLQPLFYQLVLVNHDSGANATFSINTITNTSVVANGTPWNAYYLGGTTIGLSSSSALQTTVMLQRSVSYVFLDGYWRPLAQGQNSDFNSVAQSFLAAATNPNAAGGSNKGGDQNAVLSTFNAFMTIYTLWASDSPNFPTYGESKASKNLPVWNMLQDAETYMLGNAGQDSSPNSYTGLLSK